MSMRPFDTQPGLESRLWPIQRSQRSFFDSPGWEMSPRHSEMMSRDMPMMSREMPMMSREMPMMSRDYPTQLGQMELHMRDMDRKMENMFRSFHSLMPMERGAMSSLPPSMSQVMAPMSPTTMPGMPSFGQMMPISPMEELKIENPYITDKDGNRKLKLDFDVRQFTPEEIQVKTQDRQLCVHAKHEEKGEHGQVYREYQRYFLLPDNLEPERLSSVLSPEGILSIEAPMPAIEAVKKAEICIPINHHKAVTS